MTDQPLSNPPLKLPNWDSIGAINPQFRRARFLAVVNGKNHFTYFCDACDAPREYDTLYGVCLICTPVLRARSDRNNPLRASARRTGQRHYRDTCDECGPTLHWVKCGRCSVCYAADGMRRDAKRQHISEARRAAMDLGERAYTDTCLLHGEGSHHTLRGLCLKCYDTLGKPRDDLYMKWCPVCRAQTAFSKVTRCCIQCE